MVSAPAASTDSMPYGCASASFFRWHVLVNRLFCVGFANVCCVALHNTQQAAKHLYMHVV